jgi:hypothetical protein
MTRDLVELSMLHYLPLDGGWLAGVSLYTGRSLPSRAAALCFPVLASVWMYGQESSITDWSLASISATTVLTPAPSGGPSSAVHDKAAPEAVAQGHKG